MPATGAMARILLGISQANRDDVRAPPEKPVENTRFVSRQKLAVAWSIIAEAKWTSWGLESSCGVFQRLSQPFIRATMYPCLSASGSIPVLDRLPSGVPVEPCRLKVIGSTPAVSLYPEGI